MAVVTGKVFIKADPGVNRKANIYVRLLDTGRADVSSVKVAETVYYQVDLSDIFNDGLPFQLLTGEIDQNRRVEISVLADLDSDGKKGKGDYITMQAYPVLTKGYPDYVEVTVKKI